MKYLITLLAVIACSACYGVTDTLEYYLNFSGKTCHPHQAMYFRRAWKEGSYWMVKDYYLKEQVLMQKGLWQKHEYDTFRIEQGWISDYHPNGKLRSKVMYVDGIKEGLVKVYDSTGTLIDSGHYLAGIPVKEHYGWNSDGKLNFKGIYSEDGSGIGEEWEYFDNGNLAGYGKTARGHKKDSIWTYYHRNRRVSSIEHYENDSLISIQCFNEDGTPGSSCFREKMPEPGYNLARYFGENMRYPREAREDGIQGTIYVMFVVNEEGRISNVQTIGPYHGGDLDKEAVRLVSGMPKWKPGIQHGQPVKVYFTQPVSFRLE